MLTISLIYLFNVIYKTEQIINTKVQFVDLVNDDSPVIFNSRNFTET